MSQSASDSNDTAATQARAAWQFFQQMLTDVTKIVTEDAESERELLEGLRLPGAKQRPDTSRSFSCADSIVILYDLPPSPDLCNASIQTRSRTTRS